MTWQNVNTAAHHTSSCTVQEWLGELPEFIGEPSNHAEFVTSAERVRARPLAFWKNALALMEVGQTVCWHLGSSSLLSGTCRGCVFGWLTRPHTRR
jgi:hypothetical protein